MERAPDRFARMVRDILAPGLRDLGFKGSAAQYLLPSEDHWVGLGIQRWYTGDSTKVHFTINLSVVKKTTWDEDPRLAADVEGTSRSTAIGQRQIQQAAVAGSTWCADAGYAR